MFRNVLTLKENLLFKKPDLYQCYCKHVFNVEIFLLWYLKDKSLTAFIHFTTSI